MTRTSHGSAPLDLSVDVDYESGRWMTVILGLGEDHGARAVRFASRTSPGHPEPVGFYDDGKSGLSQCSVAACYDNNGSGSGGSAEEWNIQSTDATVFVETVDATATIEVNEGWRIRSAPTAAFRQVYSLGSHASGVNAGVARYEEYRGGTAPGGRYGSLAWASLPCRYGGSGSAALTATRGTVHRTWPMRCTTPASEGYVVAGLVDGAAVTWTVSGDVSGIDDSAERLFVLDLPPRPPRGR